MQYMLIFVHYLNIVQIVQIMSSDFELMLTFSKVYLEWTTEFVYRMMMHADRDKDSNKD